MVERILPATKETVVTSPANPNQKPRCDYEFEEFGERVHRPTRPFTTRPYGLPEDHNHRSYGTVAYKHYALSVVLYSWHPLTVFDLHRFLHACGSETVRAMLSMWCQVPATRFESVGGSKPNEPYLLRWWTTTGQYRKPDPDPESWGAAQDYISDLAREHGMRAESHRRWREAEDKRLKARQTKAMKDMEWNTTRSFWEQKPPSVTEDESRIREFVDKNIKSRRGS